MWYREHRENALRRTTLLVTLFVSAIAVVVLSVAAMLTGLFFLFRQTVPERTVWEVGDGVSATTNMDEHMASLVQFVAAMIPEPQTLFFWLSVGTLILILSSVIARLIEYRTEYCGEKIAESLGGVLLGVDPVDLKQRRLLNVVQEISFAAGTPIPRVFLIGNPRQDECGINVFVAGNSPQNAVIGVTRTTLDYLNRDELQGIIAHEFAHILCEDMRRNTRTLCWLHGITVVGSTGVELMVHCVKAVVAVFGLRTPGAFLLGIALAALMSFFFAAGAILWVLGCIGTLCGNIVAAAIGRTRELLADANAVDFTRNPAGLASALRKIAVFPQRGRVPGDVRPEMNFLFFVTGVRTLLAAHPSVRERIYRLEGNAGLEQLDRMAANPDRYLVPITTIDNEPLYYPSQAPGPAAMELLRKERGVRGFRAIFALPEEILCTTPEEQVPLQEAFAAELQRRTHEVLSRIPAEICDAAGDPWSARGVTLAIFTSPESNEELLAADPILRNMVQKYREPVAELPLDAKIALMDLVLRTLRGMAGAQKRVFLDQLQMWMGLNAATSLAGGILTVTIRALLDTNAARSPRSKENAISDDQILEPIQRLLAILAVHGAEQPQDAPVAYLRGVTVLRPWLANLPQMLPRAELSRLRDLPQILTTITKIADENRTLVLRAVLETVAADGIVTLYEALLLRMVGASLDLPIPLLLPDSNDSESNQ